MSSVGVLVFQVVVASVALTPGLSFEALVIVLSLSEALMVDSHLGAGCTKAATTMDPSPQDDEVLLISFS